MNIKLNHLFLCCHGYASLFFNLGLTQVLMQFGKLQASFYEKFKKYIFYLF